MDGSTSQLETIPHAAPVIHANARCAGLLWSPFWSVPGLLVACVATSCVWMGPRSMDRRRARATDVLKLGQLGIVKSQISDKGASALIEPWADHG